MRQTHTHTRTHKGQHTRRMSVLTEVYKHLAVALPHVLRHGEDAGHVVVQKRVLLLQMENKYMHTMVRLTFTTNIFELYVTNILS